jgi:hypothetical protein
MELIDGRDEVLLSSSLLEVPIIERESGLIFVGDSGFNENICGSIVNGLITEGLVGIFGILFWSRIDEIIRYISRVLTLSYVIIHWEC